MSLSIGIVGLPNVGKSTLFTALTNKGGLAANYPFATIEPNVGIVPVPDDRLQALAEIDHPAKIVPATVEFVDIAGLVAGASQGEGLGNQFLAKIRETDAIAEVVRFFGDPDVTHVAGKVDPQSDVDTIKTELILADIATVEKAIPRLEKEAKRDKSGAAKLEAARKVLAGLNEGHRARTLGLTEDEVAAIYELHLLTMKPMLYIANVDEDAVDAELPEIDGCTPGQMFRRITLPLIRPILVYVVITSMIGGLQMFDVPQILTNGKGSPDRCATTMIMYLNNHMYSKNYGMAGAVSTVLFLVCAVLCIAVLKTLDRSKEGGTGK